MDIDPAQTSHAQHIHPQRAADAVAIEHADQIVDPVDLQPVTTIAGPVLVAGALWVGSTRLIDNVLSVQKA